MAHNVLGLRRFGQVIEQCEALTPAPNVLEQNRIKCVSPTAFLRKPSPRRGRSGNRLFCAGFFLYFPSSLFIFIFSLRHNHWHGGHLLFQNNHFLHDHDLCIFELFHSCNHRTITAMYV